MTELGHRRAAPAPVKAHRYERESLEFTRVVTLSDGIFAIALTLLVLTLDSLQIAPLVTFALAFFLVASAWWQHHRIVGRLAWFEPGLTFLNLAFLAGVVLVPFPTSLVGADPRSRSAVLAFLAVFALLSLLCLVFILRAQALGAWRRPIPDRIMRWEITDWIANLAVNVSCLLIAVWAPIAALAGVVLGSTLAAFMVGRIGPPDRGTWL